MSATKKPGLKVLLLSKFIVRSSSRCPKRKVKQAGQFCGCIAFSLLCRQATMDTEAIKNIFDQSKTKLRLAILAGVTRAMRISIKLLGSLSKDAECDGNEKVQKAIGLNQQNTNFGHASSSFIHFFAVVARLRHETESIFPRFVDNGNARQRFPFSFPELRYGPLEFHSS